ncbi:MAG: hypothetical protein KAG80_12735 [Nocardioides sp.]|nr:hypothetical protein [Nocardioides sp.]
MAAATVFQGCDDPTTSSLKASWATRVRTGGRDEVKANEIGVVDPRALLRALARRRPVLHSEADFQHEYAWEARTMDPELRIRLETHPEPGMRLDLMLSRVAEGRHTAVELKYLTAGWTGSVASEHFELKNQGAQDVRAYDVVKDIHRLERLVERHQDWTGLLVALTNDPSYWRPATHGRPTNADAFRIYDGVTLSGSRAWGPQTGRGTMHRREAPIDLRGSYLLDWQDYAKVDNSPRGTFQVLVVEVPRVDGGAVR